MDFRQILRCAACDTEYGLSQFDSHQGYLCTRCNLVIWDPEETEERTSLITDQRDQKPVFLYGKKGQKAEEEWDTVRIRKVSAPEAPEPAAETLDIWSDDSREFEEASQATEKTPRRPTSGLKVQQVGRYRILKEIARGGMGAVYLAVDPQLGRPVALKVLLAGAFAGHAQVKRFMREARSAAKLRHPNLVRILDMGEFDEQAYFTMDYVRGVTLREVVDDIGVLPLEEIYRIGSEVALAIHYAHRAGVVHRDIKPSNVIMTTEGHPMVTDFGLAFETDEPADRLTRTGQVLGTPAYMSPEQALGRTSEIGPLSDVYSIGALIYEMASGRPPYEVSSLASLVMEIADGPKPLHVVASGVPPALDVICQKAMAREPARRYPSGLSLAEDLSRARRGEPILARPPSTRERLRWWGNRHINAIRAVAVTLGLLSSILVGHGAWKSHVGRLDVANQIEQAASNFDALHIRLQELDSEGRFSEADQAVETFAATFAGTPSVVSAWRQRAAAHKANQAWPEELAALARSYAAATGPSESELALLELAEAFRLRWWWARLESVLSMLLDRHPDTTHRTRALELLAESAVAQGRPLSAKVHFEKLIDLSPESPAGARAKRLLPLLESLSGWKATSRIHPKDLIQVADMDRDGTLELLSWNKQGEIVVSKLNPSLTTSGLIHPPPGVEFSPLAFLPALDGSMSLIAESTAEPRRLAVYGIGDKGLILQGSWPWGGSASVTLADTNGDGAPEVYLPLGASNSEVYRSLRRLREIEPGVWTGDVPYAPLEHPISDVQFLVAADFDQDGADELVVGVTSWQSYDLRLLKGQKGSDKLEMIWRRHMGMFGGLALVERADGVQQVVVTRTYRAPEPMLFPSGAESGDPIGLYLLGWDGQGLRQVDFRAPPLPLRASAAGADGIQVGDLDGNGLEDLLVLLSMSRDDGRKRAAWILLQQEDGTWDELVIENWLVRALVELDGDPAVETVSLFGNDQSIHISGLGRSVDWQPPDPPVDSGSSDSLDPPGTPLRASQDLARMGLWRDAATVLRNLAAVSSDPGVTADLQEQAARLFEKERDFAEAVRLYQAAAQDPDHKLDALRGAFLASVQRFDFGPALETAVALLGDPALPPEIRADIEAARAQLEPLVANQQEIHVDFQQELGPAWTIEDPLSFRREHANGALRVDQRRDQPRASGLSLEWEGGLFWVEVDAEILQTDWKSSLFLKLVPEDRTSGNENSPMIYTGASGGGAYLKRTVGCAIHNESATTLQNSRALTTNVERGRWRIRLDYAPALGQARCTLENKQTGERFHRSSQLIRELPGGRYRLEFTTGSATADAHLASVRLHALSLGGTGLRLAPSESPPSWFDGHRAVSNGDYHGAVAAYDLALADPEIPTDQRKLSGVGRALALESMGRHTAAVSALTATHDWSLLKPDFPLSGESFSGKLTGFAADPAEWALFGLVRSPWLAMDSLVRDAIPLPGRLLLLYAEVWHRDLSRGDIQARQVVLDRMEGQLDLARESHALPPATLDALQVDLLSRHATVYASLGQSDRAQSKLLTSLKILESRAGEEGWSPTGTVSVLLRLARFYAANDKATEALHYAGVALDRANDPSIVADQLLTEPAIIGLWKTDPQWRALLGEDFRPGVTHMPGENPDDLDSE